MIFEVYRQRGCDALGVGECMGEHSKAFKGGNLSRFPTLCRKHCLSSYKIHPSSYNIMHVISLTHTRLLCKTADILLHVIWVVAVSGCDAKVSASVSRP